MKICTRPSNLPPPLPRQAAHVLEQPLVAAEGWAAGGGEYSTPACHGHGHVVISGQVNCRGVLRPCFVQLHYRESSRAASVHFCRDVAHRSFARAAAQGVRLPTWWVAAHRTSDAGTVRLSRLATEVSEVPILGSKVGPQGTCAVGPRMF